jgi:molecular chaperone GrpE
MSEDKEKRVNSPNEDIIEGEIIEGGVDSGSPTAAGIAQEEYDKLAQELQQSQTQSKNYFDGWQRERADFANYKRRIERDQQAMKENLTAEVLKKYLGIADDLERALKTRPTDGSAAAWSNGIELILRKLQGILDAEGIKRIPAEQEDFNPSRHEAISFEPSPDLESGQIIEVVTQGYTLGDRVIRPAQVRVARG